MWASARRCADRRRSVSCASGVNVRLQQARPPRCIKGVRVSWDTGQNSSVKWLSCRPSRDMGVTAPTTSCHWPRGGRRSPARRLAAPCAER